MFLAAERYWLIHHKLWQVLLTEEKSSEFAFMCLRVRSKNNSLILLVGLTLETQALFILTTLELRI